MGSVEIELNRYSSNSEEAKYSTEPSWVFVEHLNEEPRG